MATYGDRKSFKSAAFTTLEPALVQGLFDRYSKLTEEHPEAKG